MAGYFGPSPKTDRDKKKGKKNKTYSKYASRVKSPKSKMRNKTMGRKR